MNIGAFIYNVAGDYLSGDSLFGLYFVFPLFVVVCGAALMLERSRVDVWDEGLVVVNPLSRHRLQWREVAGFELRRRHRSWSIWVCTWDRRWTRIWGLNSLLIGPAGASGPVVLDDSDLSDELREPLQELRAELVSWHNRQAQ